MTERILRGGIVHGGAMPDPLEAIRASDNYIKADCGCEFGTVGDAFGCAPHSPTCNLYAYFVTEARRQRKPIEEYRI